ncbi:MAG: universal stress protein [Flavobacteriaceae bacterium]
MKTIVYATDLSELEVPTLRYAYKLTESLKAKLIVLYVYSVPPITVATIRSPKQISHKLEAEKKDVALHYCTQHLKEEWVKSKVEIQVQEHTSIHEGIFEKVKESTPDLLIVGMKDNHTQRGLFTGSIAKSLMGKVECPILIVPNRMRFRKIKSIVYATDFEETDIFAIQNVVNLAKPFNAKIRIVHIPTAEEYIGKEQSELFNEMLAKNVKYPNIHLHTFLSESVYQGLRTFVEQHKADVLVMLQRETDGTFFTKLFHKDLVKQMESHISIPLMSIRKDSV